MNSGYSIIGGCPESPVVGMQIGFDNNYIVTIQPTATSEDDNFHYSLVQVKVHKYIETTIQGSLENKTIDIMEKFKYTPNYDEIRQQTFLNVTPSLLAKIMYLASKEEIH